MELLISNLNKTYSNGVAALQNVNLSLQAGMFGLLGPNGAGKSSLMRTIATLQLPDSGSITFEGIDVLTQPQALRQQLGYLPQEFGVYPKISAETLLDHLATIKGISNGRQRKEQVEYLLQKTNLYHVKKKNIGTFSGGMKQRFGIAQALLGNPKLIIVDEPTAGLDPGERTRFHNLLTEIGTNTIVILSTHIVEDVSNLCEKMAIFNKGKVVFDGTPAEALSQIDHKIFSKAIDKAQLPDYEKQYNSLTAKLVGGKPTIYIYADQDPGEGFAPVEGGLEEVYFYKIGQA